MRCCGGSNAVCVGPDRGPWFEVEAVHQASAPKGIVQPKPSERARFKDEIREEERVHN